jgi:hypothetical protein
MHTHIFTCSALLVAMSRPALGGRNLFDASRLHSRRAETLDDLVRRRAEKVERPNVVARIPEPAPQAPTTSTAANLSGSDPSTVDQAKSNADIIAACTAALTPIKTVSNEAGFLGCYNIPFLNTATGVFEADLRLYQISQPTGGFSGVKPTDISVQMSYPDAAFSTLPQNTPNARRELDLDRRQNGGGMNELQAFLFVGQISKTLTLSKLKE